MIRTLILMLGLLLGLFLEMYVLTRGAQVVDPFLKPWLFIFSNVLIMSSLWHLQQLKFRSPQFSNWIPAMVWSGLGIVGLAWFFDLAADFPVDVYKSDIIPSLEVYCHRFLRGETVYAWYPVGTWGYHPTYLPFIWLPLVPAEFLKIDYRVATFLWLWLSLGGFCWWSCRRDAKIVSLLVPFLVLIAFRWLIRTQNATLAYTVEWIPAAFYAILVLSLGAKRSWVLGLALLPCLLGRYSCITWLPFGFLMLAHWRGWGFAWRAAAYTSVGLLAFYIVPVLGKDPTSFSKVMESYAAATLGEWGGANANKLSEAPYHLKNGCGFAIYAWSGLKTDVLTKIHLMRNLMLGIPFLLGLLFWWRFQSNSDYKKAPNFGTSHLYIAMALKTALGAFCVFCTIPYIYLYFVPLGLTWSLLFLAFTPQFPKTSGIAGLVN